MEFVFYIFVIGFNLSFVIKLGKCNVNFWNNINNSYIILILFGINVVKLFMFWVLNKYIVIVVILFLLVYFFSIFCNIFYIIKDLLKEKLLENVLNDIKVCKKVGIDVIKWFNKMYFYC